MPNVGRCVLKKYNSKKVGPWVPLDLERDACDQNNYESQSQH